MSFAQPLALALLLSLPLFYLVGRARLARLPTGARRAVLVARLAMVSLIVLALAQPSISRPADALAVVYALDTSDSLSGEARAQAEAWVRRSLAAAGPRDQTAVVAFGSDASVVKGFGAPLSDTALGDTALGEKALGASGTDIARALHLSQAILPPVGGRRVVLLTDGQENVGQAAEEVRYLAQQGIQVSVVPLGASPETREVLIETLDSPAYARLGESFDLTLGVYSTHETRATLDVFVDGEPVSEGAVPLRAGGNRFAVRLTASSPGFHVFRARVGADDDALPQNNELWAYTVVKEAGRVLAIAERAEEAQVLRSALEAGGLSVDVQPASALPSRLSPLDPYDGMLLVNVPAASLTFDQMKTVTSFVSSRGRGLVAVGGDASFSLGNYADTPLAEALPVVMNVPGGVERGNVGLLLVVDRSGSMETREENVSKIEMAREAAAKAVGLLESGDVVGVIGFDAASQVLVEPQYVGSQANRQTIYDRIARLEPAGGTDIRQALEEALGVMQGIRTRYRHVILLSDGRPNTDTRYDDLIQWMRSGRITLSTIAIGGDADLALMEDLARQGQGRYYYAEKAKDVPTITMRETRIASGVPSVDGRFQPRLPGSGERSPLLRALSEEQLPPLTGYVVTIPRASAQVALVSERDEPILAHWYFGLGRVVAWTSDVTPKWAGDWLSWPDFSRFWSQVVRWSLRSPADPHLGVSSTVQGRRVTLRVDATDDEGVFQDLLDLRARVESSEGQSDELRLVQTRPGRYETTFTVPAEGAYAAAVEQRQGNAVARREVAGFVVPYPAEYRAFGVNEEVLARTTAAGGRVLREPESALRRDLPFVGQTRLPVWSWLLTAAALLFPLDVGIRRLTISPAYLRRRFLTPVARACRRALAAPARLADFLGRYRPQ